MKKLKEIYLGSLQSKFNNSDVDGSEVVINGENFYKISNVSAMRPFFMSIVSPFNHWLFISSNGALSAGRKNSNNSLFPYYTDDKITESNEITGSKSIFHIVKDDTSILWEPFSNSHIGIYETTRNLYKNLRGTKIIFEEINHDLNLEFSYQWNVSDKYGFIKKSKLINKNIDNINIRILDGVQNILPWGLEQPTQNNTSNLVDAYKRGELEVKSGVGIFALSSIIVDKAEPSEALKASVAWSLGFKTSQKLLSSLQLKKFREEGLINQEVDVKAEKGAYFINTEVNLKSGEEKKWLICADVNKTSADIISLSNEITNNKNLEHGVDADIQNASDELYKLTGSSDGLQTSSDKRRNIRHFSNTLFNIMRGGIFDDSYNICKDDYIAYLKNANLKVILENALYLQALPESFSLFDLRDFADKTNDTNLKRLSNEYLPLKFSRRHGDPSRPWNQFSINTINEIDGSKVLDYEGNWRDIFQNWEALAHSYPGFIDSMILKFLNATTFDGYNPYRVTKDGFDWETIEQDNPWSYIGYWGDHQIIYLLKFLEFIESYYPNKLNDYFLDESFVYANVPYRIKSYEQILNDPKNTIDFNYENEDLIQQRRAKIGSDGALLFSQENKMIKVNFLEKILATLLSKMSNFIPGAGIWMNTQRPEWNDANNALVGNGVSMVTLYYLRRFLHFFETIIYNSTFENVSISEEQKELLSSITAALHSNSKIFKSDVSDKDRKNVMDALGKASSVFRDNIYKNGFTGKKIDISKNDLTSFVQLSIQSLEHSINLNKRVDGLFHAYNLISIHPNKVSVSHLPEMLEGQVAILSSQFLSIEEGLSVLDSLKSSNLFRDDQYSYILYPNKELPGFLCKNNIDSTLIDKSELLKALLNDKNMQIVNTDANNHFHFNGNFHNSLCLREELENLPESYDELVKKEKDLILSIFEQVFDHKSFTGRSGTFYGYEGLGSIYWHMVSKLLLSVFEVTRDSIEQNTDSKITGRLFDHYFEINEGIGTNKSPALYGGFPTDPYSHTPFGRGVQQPGMTGQVKEDILSRFGELGVLIKNGTISFNPTILKYEEFLNEERVFKFINLNNEIVSHTLLPKTLGFTVCQVPIIYKLSTIMKVNVVYKSGSNTEIKGNNLGSIISDSIFRRKNEIDKIEVYIKKN
ncbi:hypothetical protein OAD83_03295 [Gammaproteobacteria bacterium]|nr:hypothetical protein [Gammaproteobacteria bacterium]